MAVVVRDRRGERSRQSTDSVFRGGGFDVARAVDRAVWERRLCRGEWPDEPAADGSERERGGDLDMGLPDGRSARAAGSWRNPRDRGDVVRRELHDRCQPRERANATGWI